MQTPRRIFVSYRREDTAYPAGWLYDRLAERFGAGQTFKDVDSIDPGDDFVDCLRILTGHTRDIEGVAFSPDGQLLATASYDTTARLWNPATGDCLRALPSGDVSGVAFSPDGRLLATGGNDNTVRLWN